MPMSMSFPIIKKQMKQPKRFFLPCEQWIYFKIYCGAITIDTLLLDKLNQYIEDLNTKKSIKRWFFVRYYDPDYHIRLRLEMCKNEHSYEIINALNNITANLVKDNFIWKVEISSYHRELERYIWLDHTISEKLFHIDSNYLLGSLNYLENNELKFLYNFKATIDFIQLFYTSESQVLDFIKTSDAIFKQEFKLTKTAKKQLSTKYRQFSTSIFYFLGAILHGNYKVLKESLALKLSEIQKLVSNVQFPKNLSQKFDFVSGHIHMNTNRTFASNQRLYEMITYDHLYRYYNSQLQRNHKPR